MLPAGFSIWNIITPALVASLITLFYNSRAEKRRAVRDYISKTFDAARDDVRRAVEAAVEYFPVRPEERTPLQEAKLWRGERDVRHSIAALIEFSASNSETRKLLENALDDFISVLTGGSFQAGAGDADVAQARAVSAAGGKLRASIAMARQRELEAAVSSDIVSRNWQRASTYMSEPMGVPRKLAPKPKPPPEN
jgi:hypothetical protein